MVKLFVKRQAATPPMFTQPPVLLVPYVWPSLPVMQDAASIGEALAVLMGWNPAVLVPLTEVIRRELMADRLGGVLVLVDRVMAKLMTHQEAGGDVVFVTLAMVGVGGDS